jgi:hypothetical protein
VRRLLTLALIGSALVLAANASAAETEVEVAVSGSAEESVAGCRTVDVARIGRSALGFVVYRFHQVKHWCWRYPRITSASAYAYATDVDPNWDYKGVIAANGSYYTWCCGVGSSGHQSFRQGRFDNCILWIGCIRREYPWVRIRAHANGSYTYTTGL